MDTDELSSDEDGVESEDEEYKSEEDESDTNFVFVDLDEYSGPSTITFKPDEQISTVVVQAP